MRSMVEVAIVAIATRVENKSKAGFIKNPPTIGVVKYLSGDRLCVGLLCIGKIFTIGRKQWTKRHSLQALSHAVGF